LSYGDWRKRTPESGEGTFPEKGVESAGAASVLTSLEGGIPLGGLLLLSRPDRQKEQTTESVRTEKEVS